MNDYKELKVGMKFKYLGKNGEPYLKNKGIVILRELPHWKAYPEVNREGIIFHLTVEQTKEWVCFLEGGNLKFNNEFVPI